MHNVLLFAHLVGGSSSAPALRVAVSSMIIVCLGIKIRRSKSDNSSLVVVGPKQYPFTMRLTDDVGELQLELLVSRRGCCCSVWTTLAPPRRRRANFTVKQLHAALAAAAT